MVVGVSGGPDSVALVTALAELARPMEFSIVVAHLDHLLRPESGDDARFVGELCTRSGLQAHFRAVDVRATARAAGISIEEAGRRVRYDFFEKVASDTEAARIATAHHKDDVIETFFLRLFRGSSIEGLTGIPAVRGPIIRPLIDVSRDRILAF